MAFPSSHPRRRFLPTPHVDTQYPTLPAEAHDASSPTFSIRKSATFHSPPSPASSESDPILSIPSLPRRSPTSKHDLEDILVAGDSHIAKVIGAVDRSFSGLTLFSAEPHTTLADADSDPVPRFMINTSKHPAAPRDLSHLPALPQDRRAHKHHTSDSGIGSSESSVASAFDRKPGMSHDVPPSSSTDIPPVRAAGAFSEGRVRTGINGAAMLNDTAAKLQTALSEYACRQIQKHIILPIIREEKLKDFHPLVHGIPRRVNRKEITCLRDLEKVLLWLAPVSDDCHPGETRRSGLILDAKKWSVSKASFLLFCETSIQCIHTTVNYLNEREQARPTDRPYTNGYFLDLVEQVRQYASIVAASRARDQQSGESSEPTPYGVDSSFKVSTDPNSEKKLQLVGGLGQTGRPAEFAVNEGNRLVSLRTGEEVAVDDSKTGTKRAMEWASDEDVARSMARRRKSAGLAAREEQRCRECGKVFKRPCDLT